MPNSQLTVGSILLLALVLLSIGAPFVTALEPERIDLPARLKPPLFESNGKLNWFGTDELGRDLFARTLYAGRASLIIGLIASTLSAIIGSTLGLLTGYFEGPLGELVMRITEIQQAFPFLVFAIAVVGVVGAGLVPLVAALALGGWYFYARIAFAETRSIKHREFVEGAYAVGASDAHILRRHLLPNILPPLIVVYTVNIASAIIAESSLSFLGLGVPPSVPSWGSMISDGRGFIETAWWLSTIPGIFLLAAVLAANLLGDGLRLWLDPRTRRRNSTKGPDNGFQSIARKDQSE